MKVGREESVCRKETIRSLKGGNMVVKVEVEEW